MTDDKNYLGGNTGEYCKQYAPQLAVYKKAVEPVLKMLIHLPFSAQTIEVKLP